MLNRLIPGLILFGLGSGSFAAEQPLHERIDALILAGAGNAVVSPPADDAELVRRVYLDFAGRIPTTKETKTFLDDTSPDKRAKLIDSLINGSEYVTRMKEWFNVMFMERLGDHEQWDAYLQKCFEENRPWDRMAREILAAKSDDEAAKGAAFFISKRLENYGANPVDYPALTRDIGRLFIGVDLQCAECHDHLFIDDYKQVDYQGMFAFVKNISLARGADPGVQEKLTTEKLEFASVFVREAMLTGPRIPGVGEIPIPEFKKGEEYLIPPDKKQRTPGVPKFSTLSTLSERLPTRENTAFSRNMVNRLWFVFMGRGLVHPLDLHHSDNPASHPELLDLLAKEFEAHNYDIKWMLTELALTQTYQRSSQRPDGSKVAPDRFLVAPQRRLSAEQLLRSVLTATGESNVKNGATFEKNLSLFRTAFANPAREPEEEFNPSLQAALFLLNDDTVLGWLEPKPGNVLDQLTKLNSEEIAELAYLQILSREPTPEEAEAVGVFLAERSDRRPTALRNLVWALMASTEFRVNH